MLLQLLVTTLLCANTNAGGLQIEKGVLLSQSSAGPPPLNPDAELYNGGEFTKGDPEQFPVNDGADENIFPNIFPIPPASPGFQKYGDNYEAKGKMKLLRPGDTHKGTLRSGDTNKGIGMGSGLVFFRGNKHRRNSDDDESDEEDDYSEEDSYEDSGEEDNNDSGYEEEDSYDDEDSNSDDRTESDSTDSRDEEDDEYSDEKKERRHTKNHNRKSGHHAHSEPGHKKRPSHHRRGRSNFVRVDGSNVEDSFNIEDGSDIGNTEEFVRDQGQLFEMDTNSSGEKQELLHVLTTQQKLRDRINRVEFAQKITMGCLIVLVLLNLCGPSRSVSVKIKRRAGYKSGKLGNANAEPPSGQCIHHVFDRDYNQNPCAHNPFFYQQQRGQPMHMIPTPQFSQIRINAD